VQLIQAWWSGCFTGVFRDFVVQRDGKSWTSCGELRGKRGWETTPFLRLEKQDTILKFIFRGLQIGNEGVGGSRI
jgi:hypothetical protein